MGRILIKAVVIPAVDPTTLDYDGLWRDYAGSPLAGTPSAGDSGLAARTLSEATNPPAVGASLNGHACADADGVNDQLAVESGAAATHYMSDDVWEGYVLFRAGTAAPRDIDEGYNEPGIIVDNSGSIGVSFSAGGFSLFRNTVSVGWYGVYAPCPTGQIHVGTFVWDGANNALRVGIDGPPNTSMFCLPRDISISARNLVLMRNYNSTARLDAEVWELGISQTLKTDEQYRGVVEHINQRYGLSLTQPSNVQAGRYPGTSSPANTYTQTTKTTSAAFSQRDGAHLHYIGGQYVLLGGWASSPRAEWANEQTTNQVYTSSDLVTWTLALAHDNSPPTLGATARWTRRHTFGSCVVEGYVYVVGSDQYISGTPDVWRSPDGVTAWERRTALAPWRERVALCVGSYGSELHVIGGHPLVASVFYTAQSSHYVSSDGGATWRQLADAPFSTAYITRLVEHDGHLFACGGNGGAIAGGTRVYQNSVWAWDGTTWRHQCVAAEWSGRMWNDVVSYDDKLWVIAGRVDDSTDAGDAWYSRDAGQTWTEVDAPWPPTHADGICATDADGIVMASGFGMGTSVFALKVVV